MNRSSPTIAHHLFLPGQTKDIQVFPLTTWLHFHPAEARLCVKLIETPLGQLELTGFTSRCSLFRQTSRWTCSSATGRAPWAVWPRRRRGPGGSCWSAPTTTRSAWERPTTGCCCARWRATPRAFSAWRWVQGCNREKPATREEKTKQKNTSMLLS